MSHSRISKARRDAIGITSYIKDGLCSGRPPQFAAGAPQRPSNINTASKDPILFGIMVDNAFARRINRGAVSSDPTVSGRVTRIVAECSGRDVHLIAAQVKMPEQEFRPRSARDKPVRIRTELDAIGYIPPKTAAQRGTIVVIELKTSVGEAYGDRFFSTRGPVVREVPGFSNCLFDRHTVQVLFGMHCVEAYREELGVSSTDNIVGLLLYSQPSGCRSVLVDPAANPRHKQLWDQRNTTLFSQNRINPAQRPLKTARQRRDVAFKGTTWWKTKVQPWPSLEARKPLEAALVKMLNKTQHFRNRFNIEASEGTETNTLLGGYPNVSAVFDSNAKDRKLFVCVVTGKYASPNAMTKKPDRIREIFRSAIDAGEANLQTSVFVVVSQTGVVQRRRTAGARKPVIGWKAELFKKELLSSAAN